jgi:hypothetical protein
MKKSNILKSLVPVALALAAPLALAGGAPSELSTPLTTFSGWLKGLSVTLIGISAVAIAWSLLTSEHGTPFKSAVKWAGAGGVAVGGAGMASSLFGGGFLF